MTDTLQARIDAACALAARNEISVAEMEWLARDLDAERKRLMAEVEKLRDLLVDIRQHMIRADYCINGLGAPRMALDSITAVISLTSAPEQTND